jgi:MerC mercury resistance protein
MINKQNFFEKLDKAGMILSVTCLVHCLILPVLLATLPFVSFLSFMKLPLTETLMILFAIFNAILAVTFNFQKHNNLIVPAFFFSGTILLLLNFIAHSFVQKNEYLITIGAFLIGVGHLINHKLCGSCPKCTHE